MYPLEIISKVVKIQNRPRHKIDFIGSGLGTFLYLSIKTIEFKQKLNNF
jgi:hypothetical protein